MSAVDVVGARREERAGRIAAALRAEWRMIASVSLRQRADEEGFDAEVRLDPVVVKGAAEQQGQPRTPAALSAVEARRYAAIEDCVQRVNEGLSSANRIGNFTVID